jgi:transposase
MKNIQIDRDVLYDLYITQNNSTIEVAKILNVSKFTIVDRLKRYGIKKDKDAIKLKMEKTNLEKYGTKYPSQSEQIREKVKQTNLEKYGCENPFQSEEVKEKIKKVNLDRYGVECPMRSDQIKEKLKKTNLERYGVEYPAQSKEIYDKVKQTNLEKYGCENPLKSEEVKEKIKKVNLEKYGVEHVMYSEQIKEKIKKTNLDRYGVEYPMRLNKVKNKFKSSLLNNNFPNVIKYFADKETTENFLKKNYNEKTTVIQLSKDTGVSKSVIGQYIHKYGLEDYIEYVCKVSQPEKDIVDYLTSKGIANIIQSDRDILDGKEIDIYLPDYKVGIEFNGDYWHSELKRDKRYHYDKSMLANSKGVFLYHIFSHEWDDEEKRIRILNHLDNILHLNENKIYARKCMIREVDVAEKNDFLNENHIQGKDNSTIKLGLYYNDELVSLMTFCYPRFSRKYNWELSRFCSKHNYNVIGGASKLFKYFVDNYMKDGEVIVSYSDIAKTTGKIYNTLNFEFVNDAEPNYIWWKSDDDYKTRYQCQMVNERIIMESNGYIKIYDCGNKVWVFRK